MSCAAVVGVSFPASTGATTDAFRFVKFTNCIRLTDGLYEGTASAYSMLYSGSTDTRIAFAIVVTTKGHPPDRVGAIFATRRPAWLDRFGGITIRGFSPVVPRSDTTATEYEKAALAKHARTAERRCVASAQR
jgi:hypothetical protein